VGLDLIAVGFHSVYKIDRRSHEELRRLVEAR
jgi:hypothetical protein